MHGFFAWIYRFIERFREEWCEGRHKLRGLGKDVPERSGGLFEVVLVGRALETPARTAYIPPRKVFNELLNRFCGFSNFIFIQKLRRPARRLVKSRPNPPIQNVLRLRLYIFRLFSFVFYLFIRV